MPVGRLFAGSQLCMKTMNTSEAWAKCGVTRRCNKPFQNLPLCAAVFGVRLGLSTLASAGLGNLVRRNTADSPG